MLQWLLQNHTADAIVKVGLCPEAAVLLLKMIKALLSKVSAILGMMCRDDSDSCTDSTLIRVADLQVGEIYKKPLCNNIIIFRFSVPFIIILQ